MVFYGRKKQCYISVERDAWNKISAFSKS